ncbi:Zn(2)-C6 fungal-type domain-containing protein [Fusarium sp. LHS14.1]|nr:Zn(2)-C6 fungal-type domain-containing protein [Fusarium sp. LHS14.1]
MSQGKVTHPRHGLRGIRRDRDCRSCKSRGVKCDLNRPRCLPCVQSGLTCGGYPQRVVWATNKTPVTPTPELSGMERAAAHDNHEASSLESQPQLLLVYSPTSEATPQSFHTGLPGHQRTASHPQHRFADRLSAWCTELRLSGFVDGDERRARVAVATTRLLDHVERILRWHMEYQSTLPPTPLKPLHRPSGQGVETLNVREYGTETDFELQYVDALASLNQVLENANPVAFLGILVLAYFEVLSTSAFGQWQFHLQGARSLLDHHFQSREDIERLGPPIGNLPEMIAYFSWWDVAGVVVRHLSASRAESHGRLIFLDWHRDLIGAEFFDTVGCPPEIFQLFVSLAKSTGTSHEVSEEEALFAERERYVLAIQQLLQLGLVEDGQGLCRDTWRCAAVIALLTWDSPSQPTDDLMDDCRQKALTSAVDRICRGISSVPLTSRLYMHMAKPVFLAGINATSLTQCEVIREYWCNLQADGAPRHLGALAQCEERWKKIPRA